MRLFVLALITYFVAVVAGVMIVFPKAERALDEKTATVERLLQQQNHEFQVRADALLAHRLGVTGF